MRSLLYLLALLMLNTVTHAAPSLGSRHALVVDESSGEVLLAKNERAVAPIASLTKLFTAMAVLDAGQDLDEQLTVTRADLDRLKHTTSGVRAGTRLSRHALLELALLASDNHAASALARHFPGDVGGYQAATARQLRSLGLARTTLVEPTGLSPKNRSNALELATVLRAAGAYAELGRVTAQYRAAVEVAAVAYVVRNTNRLVGQPGWEILLSKTGYTREAGRCLAMRLRVGSRVALVVLLGARTSAQRASDALAIRRMLEKLPPAPGLDQAAPRAAVLDDAPVDARGASALVTPFRPELAAAMGAVPPRP